jgi:4-hydroxybenzoate polyprenyltransferase
MNKLKTFIDLTRLNKPIGFMLLFWPSLWGLTLGYNNFNNINLYIYYSILFFLGSVLMRSAGCIVNDIIDKDYDKKVKRTKSRPLPSEKVSIKESFLYCIILCSLAFLILIQFNTLTIFLGIASMSLAFTYPFMKRVTYWPQLFLGITFNWGIIMAWAAINNEISVIPIVLYIAAIFWTLGYDTIYGLQDVYDDEIIGLKSTSIKFKQNIKLFVGISYFLFLFFLMFLLSFINFHYVHLIFIIMILTLLSVQILKLDTKSPLSCLKIFKSNNWVGFSVFVFILSLKIF